MATPAQIQANRANAAASTGPKTEAGRAAVSQNALRSGLFSTRNCVASEDADAYDTLRAGLWDYFTPQNPAEEMFTAEIVRCSWRLRRCAQTEEGLLDLTDPAEIASTQASVDRARTQASGVLHRAMEQLRKLQTERWLRSELVPAEFDSSKLGIASGKEVFTVSLTEARRQFVDLSVANARGLRETRRAATEAMAFPMDLLDKYLGNPKPPSAKQSQSAADAPPRNAPCPCGSGLKSKRCCNRVRPAAGHNPGVVPDNPKKHGGPVTHSTASVGLQPELSPDWPPELAGSATAMSSTG